MAVDVQTAITAAKDCILAIAATVTSTAAVLGLKRWQAELRGKADFEVARGLIRATYKLRDEIQFCRAPVIRGAEFPSDYDSIAKNTPQVEAEAWAHVYRNRFKPVWTAVQEFDSQALEAEALWGADTRESANALRACVHKLDVAIETIIEDKLVGGQNFKADRDFGVQTRAIAAASVTAKDNALSNEIAKAVGDIETRLRRHLSRRR